MAAGFKGEPFFGYCNDKLMAMMRLLKVVLIIPTFTKYPGINVSNIELYCFLKFESKSQYYISPAAALFCIGIGLIIQAVGKLHIFGKHMSIA